MKVQQQLIGWTDLARGLGQLPTRVSKRVVRAALMAGGQPIASMASQKAPRAPGEPDLADNIIVAPARSPRGDASTTTVAIGPRASFGPRSHVYPTAQELGTAFHEAHPYLRPAFEARAHGALGIIGSAIMAALITRDVVGSTRGSGGGGGLL